MPVAPKIIGGSGNTIILEVLSDPISPVPTEVWILKTQLSGTPIGLLLSLTYPLDQYQLSYRTANGRTIRTILS